jgi:hypothetical protein
MEEQKTKTKTKLLRPVLRIRTAWHKHRIHIIYLLIIANIIIWAKTNDFYNDYVDLLTKSQVRASTIKEKAHKDTQAKPGSKQWVLEEVRRNNIDPTKVDCLVSNESGWDPQARNTSVPGNIDMGLFQWSTKYQIDPGFISIGCIGNVECETYKFIEKVKQDKNFSAWHGYTHNCQWLGTDPFIN